jgi:hypothetical protein
MKTIVLAVLMAAIPACAAEIYTFDLLPSNGSIAGAPGSTVGWGYSIQNESASLWLVTSGLNSGVFTNGTPHLLFDFPIIGPGQTAIVPYDPTTLSGLMALTWNPSAPLGVNNTGSFVLAGEWWNGDPLVNGTFVSSAPDQSQMYTATTSATVPEPGSSLVVASSLFLLGSISAFRRCVKRQSWL